jgi:redox-sensitive bicupin YhaK (pirin superfamily)
VTGEMSIARKIIRRTRGSSQGSITRLMSPGDLGQILKPFVFLDHFDLRGGTGGTKLHPHSGIATVTFLFEGSIQYEDSNGTTGLVRPGGVEWFKAAHGAWHAGGPGDSPRTRGFQLWLALPPGHELGAVENIYLEPGDIAHDGPARVLVGAHGGAISPLIAGVSLNYLAVRLNTKAKWQYCPGKDHKVGWVSVSSGRIRVPDEVDSGELAIFDPSVTPIDFVAESDAEFVVGSAAPFPFELALGRYSVHTSASSLQIGEQRLRDIQSRLRSEGRL